MMSAVNALRVQRSENSQKTDVCRTDFIEELEFHYRHSLWKIMEVEHVKMNTQVNWIGTDGYRRPVKIYVCGSQRVEGRDEKF